MKTKLATGFILLSSLPFLIGCSDGRAETRNTTGKTVYVCSGKYAKRYHYSKSCKGLLKCSGRIITTTTADAIESGKTACRICVKR